MNERLFTTDVAQFPVARAARAVELMREALSLLQGAGTGDTVLALSAAIETLAPTPAR